MKVVICDDNAEDLAEIDRLLAKYQKSNGAVSFETGRFTDSEELYRQIQTQTPEDIYILDMIMSQKTGIDLGTLIRSTSQKSAIIYITSSDDFAFEAYGVHAVRYLLKPVSEKPFFEAMDYAVSGILKEKKDAVFPVKTKEGLTAVSCSRIEYIESYARMLNICLADGKCIQSIFIRRSFGEEIRQLTEDRRFLQVHKSFLVNMEYVDRLTQDSVIMESGKIIPVSKTRAADVKKEYLRFVSEQY